MSGAVPVTGGDWHPAGGREGTVRRVGRPYADQPSLGQVGGALHPTPGGGSCSWFPARGSFLRPSGSSLLFLGFLWAFPGPCQ